MATYKRWHDSSEVRAQWTCPRLTPASDRWCTHNRQTQQTLLAHLPSSFIHLLCFNLNSPSLCDFGFLGDPILALFGFWLSAPNQTNKYHRMQTSIEYGFIDTSTMPSKDFPNVPASEHMTDPQLLTLTVLERTGGCISLVAVFAIFIAYWLIREVRNVQNTFIVFASVSNVGASIASTIAMDGLKRGRDSSLCQAQSFMFEM